MIEPPNSAYTAGATVLGELRRAEMTPPRCVTIPQTVANQLLNYGHAIVRAGYAPRACHGEIGREAPAPAPTTRSPTT
jgi:hypothetical protein